MELYFIPSDIARIILGYLKENSYIKTYNCFLKECSHLRELYNLEKAGRSLKKVTQLSLIKIVEEWGRYKYSSERNRAGGNNLAETPSSDDTVDDNLVFDNDVTSSGRKTKQRARSSSKKSPQLSKTGRFPSTPKSFKSKLKSPRRALPQKIESQKTVEDGVIQSGNSELTEESPENTKNSTTNKDTPNKLEIHSEKSYVPVNSLLNDAVSKTKTCTTSESTVNQASDGCMKTAESIAKNAMRTDLTKTVESETSEGKTSGFEKEVKKLTEQENGNISKSENTMFEPNHSNTEELVTELTEDIALKETSSQKVTIMSGTFIKTAVEPPSESVGSVEDKCLSWMTRNDCEKVIEHERAQKSEKVHSQFGSEEAGSKSSGTNSSKTPGVTSSSNTSDEGAAPVHATPKKLPHSAPREQFLVTPVKLHGSELNTSKSPRRKKPKTPRKRASEVSPVSVVSTRSVDPSSVNPIFEKILADHRLHEKLAETCNLVHSQIKFSNSGKEYKDKTHSIQAEQLSLTPVPHSEETVTASRSLEEILGIDHNFHTDLLSDNIDMSDPAYESLFKLFGTDRETFNEYLRKEKEKELALMEAEVEELERSNHEIMCANFGVSQADAGYETQELAYNSPHHIPLGSQQDLFSTQHGSHSPRTSHVTSTPCGTGAPVNFTPLLRGNELGSSPLHSTSVFGGAGKAGADKKTSPCSTVTQPFSPALSHYSEVNNPPTPLHQQHLSTYINGSCHGDSPGGPSTPRNYTVDQYSNPATPQQSSTQHSQLMHSTPTGSVKSCTNSDHFHQSSPIQPQHNAVTNTHAPTHWSPLVKADLHPQSPFSTQNQTSIFQSATNSGLYFNSQVVSRANHLNGQNFETNVNRITGMKNFSEHPIGYLNLLNDESSLPTSREPCSTIENTIGCISLPQPTNIQERSGKQKKSTARKSRRKQKPVKRTESYANLKNLLNKPLRIPNSVPLTMRAPGLHHLARTPEKRIPDETNLSFRSPGGKTVINVPVLNCEDEIDLSVLGMDDNIDLTGSQVVNVYGQNLDTSVQYAIAPENQATHNLVNAIQAGNTAEAVKQISQRKKDETKRAKKSNSDRKRKAKSKKEQKQKGSPHTEHFSPTPSSTDHPVIQQDGYLDPNEIYTATIDTSIGKAATARALNFGPDVEHYRKIMPKPSPDTGPSILILTSNQVINPVQNVIVNTVPATVVQDIPSSSGVVSQSNTNINANTCSETEELDKMENIATVKIIDMTKSDSSGEKRLSQSGTLESKESSKKRDTNSGCDLEVLSDEHTSILQKTPNKEKQRFRQPEVSSSEKRLTRSVTSSKSSEKQNPTRDENQISDTNTASDKQKFKETPKKENQTRMFNEKVTVNLGRLKLDKENDSKTENKIKRKKLVTRKNKKNKRNVKLKVKLPVMSQRSPRTNWKNCELGKSVNQRPPRTKGKNCESGKSVNPFCFKKKSEVKAEPSSSDEDLPLSEIRKKDRSKTRNQKESETVNIVIESESTDEEKWVVKDNLQFTPKKTKESSDEDRTPSKEMLFEKIGLTPKKLLLEHDLKSPKRANVLDVLAELQGSPTSLGRLRLRSDTKRSSSLDDVLTSPRRRAHAKQLFSSPDKEKSPVIVRKKAKQKAKRVDWIIDKLKQHNPGRNLAVSRETLTVNNTSSQRDAKRTDQNKTSKSKSRNASEKKGAPENESNSGAKKNYENRTTESKILEEDNEDPLVGLVKENDGMNSVPDENEMLINTDTNAVLSDGNSQDASELDRAIASIEFNEPDTCGEQEKLNAVEDKFECNSDDTEKNNGFVCKRRYSKHSLVKLGNKGGPGGNFVTATDQGFSETVNRLEHINQVVVAEVHASQNSKDTPEKSNTFQCSRNLGSLHQSDKRFESCSTDNFSDSEKKLSNSEIFSGNNYKSNSSNAKVETVNSETEIRTSDVKKHKCNNRDRSDTDKGIGQFDNCDRKVAGSDKNSHGASEVNRAVSVKKYHKQDDKSLEEQILPENEYVNDELRCVKSFEEKLHYYNFNSKRSENLPARDCDKQVSNTGDSCLPAANPDLCEKSIEIDVSRNCAKTVEKLQDTANPQPVHYLDTESEKHLRDACSDFERSRCSSERQIGEKCSGNIEVNTVEKTPVSSENKDSRHKHKKKKRRKQRHCHRHRSDTNSELTSICETGREDSDSHHHHKKKKSKKRHRDDEEDGRESKRRRKEKRTSEMVSLASINIDEAISIIYGSRTESASNVDAQVQE